MTYTFNDRPQGRSLALLVAAVTLLTGCGGGAKSSPPTPKTVASTPQAPPPNYSAEQLKSRSLSPREVGDDIREIAPAIEALQLQQVPLCSLTKLKLNGAPEIVSQQYSNPVKGKGEVKYAQLIARYNDANSANTAFNAIRRRALDCTPKRHVPAKKIQKNFVVFAHDDTWKTSEDTIVNWKHIRGTEQQTYPASASKDNILHLMHDYAVRGNVVIATVYWERTEPKKSVDPIARRATELLTKQLQKFG